jgi:hypothetical protein
VTFQQVDRHPKVVMSRTRRRVAVDGPAEECLGLHKLSLLSAQYAESMEYIETVRVSREDNSVAARGVIELALLMKRCSFANQEGTTHRP